MKKSVIVQIQNILWPQPEICSIEDMYFRIGKDCVFYNKKVMMSVKSKLTSDTYFNGVSIEKWKKYTILNNLRVCLKLKGKIKVSLKSCELIGDDIIHRVLSDEIVELQELQELNFVFPDNIHGMAYFELEALSEDCEFAGGYYFTIVDVDKLQHVKLGIGICTFKREEFIYHNLQVLKDYLIENAESTLYGKMEVFVADNGRTLESEKSSSKGIHIFPNKNAGGAAGFTRTMIEAINANKNGDVITHLILMDDDISIDPAALQKTYCLLTMLKEQYKNAFIGGAMLRNDKQSIQIESGAFWNAGNLISLKHNLNMSKLKACLYNEIEEARQYNAWWYCCIPMSVIREDNLPMPLFIRGDDVEYGLRNTKLLILMNGICVWHEPFENKYSSSLSYYILRNQLIDNALHCPKYNRQDLKRDINGRVVREIMYCRYKNVDLLVKGVRDYLKGVDWLLASDGEALHREIMKAGYNAQPVDELPIDFFYSDYARSLAENDKGLKKYLRLAELNGYLLPAKGNKTVSMAKVRPYNVSRAKKILYYDETANKGFICEKSFVEMVRCVKELLKVNKEIDKKFNWAKKDYRNRQKELQNIEFWKKYLNLV